MSRSKWLPWVMLALAFLGFADAAYLTAAHYLELSLPCFVVNGCDLVTRSAYSMAGPAPVALLGALYYLGIFGLLLAYADAGREAHLRLAARATWLGFLFSAWLVYLQIFVIRALCGWCLVSAAISTLLFCLGQYHLLTSRPNTPA